ncbi:MAG: M20/M25/M40 family metallo-hydrolase, partial [Emcibacter sp.]|nr:M20/M25/M40 family metallo-hydrolase [Emcibacter sp.]
LLPQTGSSAETLVLALANQNGVSVVSYGTEAGIFQATGGVPTVVCGPGSIDQAHKPDEYIELSELRACDEFLGRLLKVIKN